uniref:LysM domain-containing protein n=1 Tax=Ananas comosus var. bracteatus TaxID=296719 RepID=A0A6V7Q3S0_ANACO|nr:unnamed protein product [Ananas comosus var. bracteatus]
MDIKRLNNMMSDHGIYSRERLLIPIGDPQLLFGSTCYIELDEHAKREVAVLYLESGPNWKPDNNTNNVISNRRWRKVLESVRRSMQVDEGTAEYYLSVSNGDRGPPCCSFQRTSGGSGRRGIFRWIGCK